MRRSDFLVVAGMAAALIAGAIAYPAERLYSVVDGDTVRLVSGQLVRLVGYDTPEIGSHARCERERRYGEAAKARLERLLASAEKWELTIVPCACAPGTEGTKACNFGRQCGRLTIDGRDAAAVLVGERLAMPYHCGKHSCPQRVRPWCG